MINKCIDDFIIIKPNVNSNANLIKSFNKGILYPIIIGKFNSKKYIIDGVFRYEISKIKNIPIDFKMMNFNCLEDIISSLIRINSSTRKLHLIEKAFLIYFVSANDLKLNLSELLEMRIDENIIELARRITLLPKHYLQILKNQKPSFKMTKSLWRFSNEQLEELEPFVSKFVFSQSNFYKFFDLLYHYIFINEITIQSAFQSDEIIDILTNKLLSEMEKSNGVLEFLTNQVKPLYCKSLSKLQILSDSIRSKSGIQLNYNTNLEDEFFRISYKINNEMDLQDFQNKLSEQTENLLQVLQIVKCKD